MLVTSRVGDRQRWGPVARIVPLESLGDVDGAQVLLDLAPGAGDRADAESLSGQLGGLPLALHQAALYLASPFAAEATFTQYRQALSVRFGELMGRGEEDRVKVIATWELSLDALQAQGIWQARLLLGVLSCFASAVPVPPLLLDRDVLARMCGSTAGAEDGLAGLSSVGLVSRVLSPQAGVLAGLKVHPLVAQTIRYRAGDVLPESLVLDHRDTLSARHEIARMLAAQGKPADAEAEFRQVLDAELRVLGPDHPFTLTAVNWLKHLQR